MENTSVTLPVFESETRLRHALSRTWHAFFARFPNLREIQKAAVLPILKGNSVVVNAPTASGKTEAIMAPVLERFLKNRTLGKSDDSLRTGPAILVVAPTKALCNDLCRRLTSPVENLGLSIAIRTGDNPSFNPQKPPTVVVTTPESLDSLVSRIPASFQYLEAIILDEIHLVSASGRGDQLQCLLARLRILNKHPIQVCASSATVPEIERICREYLGEDGQIISMSEGTRNIQSTILDIPSEPRAAIRETAKILESLLLETPTRKILVFCNARATVENLVHEMRANPRIASQVFAHHGSLSREERLRTEQQFLRARNAACVATSTLELGIDIGDVDRTVLLGPPPDVSSLIQRIGRGNRTESCVHVVCLADCPFNRYRFRHLVECARRELIFPDSVSFRPTTLIQQALSICLQNPQKWVGKQALYDRLSPTAQRKYGVSDCGLILDSMVSAGKLLRKVDRGRYVPESKAQFLFNRGFMHSMIVDRGETDVVDTTTGRTLGTVYLKKNSRDAIASGSNVNITLAGNAHTVSYIRDEKIFVKRGEDTSDLSFLALEPPRYSVGLAQDFARFMHIPQDGVYVRCVSPDQPFERLMDMEAARFLDSSHAMPSESAPPGAEWVVCHFLGTVGGALIQHFFEKSGCTVKKGTRTPFFLRLSFKPTIQSFPDAEHLATLFELYIRANVSVFARLLQPGPWFQLIPENLALNWITSSLDTRAFAQILANKPIILI